MEKSTIIGIVSGVLAVGVGMILKGAHLSALWNPAAIMIIFVGTAASLFVAFPMTDMKKIPKLFKVVFHEPKLLSKNELIRLFVEWGGIARREGLLALESTSESVTDPFLKNGLKMIIDGSDNEFVRDVLLEDVSAMEERHRVGAQVFTQAGMYAPTLGVLGAVIGLISALGNLNDIEKLGHSVAAAFIATLFGIFTGYVLWHPMSNKLKRISKQEAEIKLMIVEGLLSFAAGSSPNMIKQKLLVYLTPTERLQIDVAEKAGSEGAPVVQPT